MDSYKKTTSEQKETNRYFQEALSDFMYDTASGRAIRHLVDAGYTAAQIIQQLDYPTPFSKIQLSITKYLKETGILTTRLPVPPKDLTPVYLPALSGGIPQEALYARLAKQARQDGEGYAYFYCPFSQMAQTAGTGVPPLFSVLTAREREYLTGIIWEPGMYHRLNRRMLEIGTQLAMHSDAVSFLFLKSREQAIIT